jgi:transposase
MTKRTAPFFLEVRERAMRMVRDHEGEHGSRWSAVQSIAAKIGCSGETLRNWVRESDRDQGV